MRLLETVIELTFVDILHAQRALLAISLMKTEEVLREYSVSTHVKDGGRFHEARLKASKERLRVLLEQSSRSIEGWRADHPS